MKHFLMYEVEEAKAHAEQGGQALHTHNIIVNERTAPRCFVRAVQKGEMIAHLFDQDKERLMATARRLGVSVIFVDNEDTPWQHIDLCGKPLQRAMLLCKKGEDQ